MPRLRLIPELGAVVDPDSGRRPQEQAIKQAMALVEKRKRKYLRLPPAILEVFFRLPI